MRARAACASCALLPLDAIAHGAELHDMADLWHAYSLDPFVVIPMTLFGVWYTAGILRLWSRAGWGRGVQAWRAAAFCGGMLALFFALIWPLDALGSSALSAHMAQHVTLTAVAAPLLAASAPLVTGLWALPRSWRRAVGSVGTHTATRGGRKVLTLPIFAWIFYASILWIWHMPGPYQAAVLDDTVHTLEHMAFLAGALLLWWTVLLSVRGSVLGLGSGIFLLFTTGLQEGLLGALLTFSPRPLYPVYETGPGLWNITALEDQQLAGLLMWIPGGFIYLSGALLLCYLWLARMARSGPELIRREPTLRRPFAQADPARR